MRPSSLYSAPLIIALFSILVAGRLVARDLELMRVVGYDTSGYALGVAVSGNYAYVADSPVLTASLRHQVILDTQNGNAILMHFDLTVISAETFTVGDQKHRLGQPGQKMTRTNYGRPNTFTTQPGQFVFVGVAISHDPTTPPLPT